MFQIGDLTDIRPNDPKFNNYDYDKAEEEAIMQSNKTDRPYGIWDIENDCLLKCIVYQGGIYRE